MDNEKIELADIIRVFKSLKEDGSLEKEDAVIVLSLFRESLSSIRPHVKKMWLSIAIAGLEKIIDETINHIEELEK